MIERFRESDELNPVPDQIVSLMQHWAELEMVQKFRAGKIQDALARAASLATDDTPFVILGEQYVNDIDTSINPLLTELRKDVEALVGWHISFIREWEFEKPDAHRVEGWITASDIGVSTIRGGEISSFILIDEGKLEKVEALGTFIWNMRDIVLTPPDWLD